MRYPLISFTSQLNVLQQNIYQEPKILQQIIFSYMGTLKNLVEGLALWCNRSSHHLQCWDPTRLLVQALASSLPIQLHANALGKVAEDGSSRWAPATMGEIPINLPAPTFSLAQQWMFRPFSESVDGRPFCLSLYLSL